jgi:hypothetical protein
MKLIGVDVGGTFTNIVFTDTVTGRTLIPKAPTAPDDPSHGVVTAVGDLCERFGLARGDDETYGAQARGQVTADDVAGRPDDPHKPGPGSQSYPPAQRQPGHNHGTDAWGWRIGVNRQRRRVNRGRLHRCRRPRAGRLGSQNG